MKTCPHCGEDEESQKAWEKLPFVEKYPYIGNFIIGALFWALILSILAPLIS